jgi:branched-chain amino acid transport system ATP-binding protein
MIAQPLLSLVDVEAGYGKLKALHGISLCVARSEIVALLGANGAGKSTTLRVISGLIKASAGDVTFDGRSIANQRPDVILGAGLAHCPEERHVWPDMTVEENLSLGGYLCRSKAELAQRIDMVIEPFPRLRERYRQLSGTLSGGEQQMLAIARALMSKPRLLLLDEPSLGLAPRITQELLAVLRQLRDRNMTIVLVEQNVHNALSIADRAYVFETGRVVAEDTAKNLLSNPDLLRAYLGG